MIQFSIPLSLGTCLQEQMTVVQVLVNMVMFRVVSEAHIPSQTLYQQKGRIMYLVLLCLICRLIMGSDGGSLGVTILHPEVVEEG